MNSPIDNLLSRLEKVRKTGPDSWQAQCPSHDDRGPSLTIREAEDGKVLLHCFAGCSIHDVVEAVGMDLSDLFPQRQHHGKPERRPFPAMNALQAVAFESLVVAASGAALLAGQPFSTADHDRLMVAVSRIQAAALAVMPMRKGKCHV